MLKKQLLSIFEALLYIMLTYWLIDSFFAFNKYDWMLESGDNICSIPSVSGEDRILQAMIAHCCPYLQFTVPMQPEKVTYYTQ